MLRVDNWNSTELAALKLLALNWSIGGTLPLESHFEEHVPQRAPHSWAPQSHKAMQSEGSTDVTMCQSVLQLLQVYKEPPAWRGPTNSLKFAKHKLLKLRVSGTEICHFKAA